MHDTVVYDKKDIPRILLAKQSVISRDCRNNKIVGNNQHDMSVTSQCTYIPQLTIEDRDLP